MPPAQQNNTLRDALARIAHEIVEGCRHGFFDYTIIGETLRQGECSVTVKAGKSYRFRVPESDLVSPLTTLISDPENKGATLQHLPQSEQHNPVAAGGHLKHEDSEQRPVEQAIRQKTQP